MLQPSEIISAQALVTALKQQSDLPAEIQTKFQAIGQNLQVDPSYLNRSIQDCIDLVRTYKPLETVYQTERDLLQGVSNNRSKGLPPTPIDPATESSQEIFNSVRDVCLNAGTPPPPPKGFWGRLFGKKS
jgi:hypothetical protein